MSRFKFAWAVGLILLFVCFHVTDCCRYIDSRGFITGSVLILTLFITPQALSACSMKNTLTITSCQVFPQGNLRKADLLLWPQLDM